LAGVRATPDGTRIRVPGIGWLDLRLHASGDHWISAPIRQGYLMDPHVMAALGAFIRPGDTFLDVGGNIGWFAVIGSRQVGPGGKVFTIEPDPDNAALLRENLRRNGCANATLCEAAAGAVEGTARLFRSPDNAGDHQMAVASERTDWVEVLVRPLDALLDGVARVDVLKMDTQGSEVLALRGMQRLLAANPAIRMVLEFWPHGLAQCGCTAEELIALLGAHPRRYWLMDHAKGIAPVTPD
jgi:FkbM family methyltransferase